MMLIKKVVPLVLCIACGIQSMPMDALGGRLMRSAFSSQSVKWGAVVACLALGLVAYGYVEKRNGNTNSEESFPSSSNQPNTQSSHVSTPFLDAIKNYTADKKGFRSVWNGEPNLNERDNLGKNWIMYAIDHSLAQRPLNAIFQNVKSCKGKDHAGKTPLMYAVQQKRTDLIPFLIDKKCKLNAQDKAGKTSLHYAIESQDHKAAKELLEYDEIDVNLVDAQGHTPLISAIINGQDALAGQLLNRDDIQTQVNDVEGHSALYCAVQMERADLVTALLKKYPVGTNVNAEMSLAANNAYRALSDIINDYRNGTGDFVLNSLP